MAYLAFKGEGEKRGILVNHCWDYLNIAAPGKQST